MKQKITSESVQTFVRWAILIFLGYALLHNVLFPSKPPAPLQTQQPLASNVTKDPDCAKKEDDYPLFSVPLVPIPVPMIKVEEITAGAGKAAVCGQEAKIRYEYKINKTDSLAKGVKHVVIGGGRELHGVELGLIGMKPGGERRVVLPSVFAHAIDQDSNIAPSIQGKTVFAQMSLLELSPAVPEAAFPLKAINSGFIGNGGQVICGDRVKASITLWKNDGTKIFSTDKEPLTFVLGQSQLSYGIEQGILGMLEGGERVVVMAPAYTKPLLAHDSRTQLLPALPENEIILAEIHLLHIDTFPAKEVDAEDTPVHVQAPAASQQEKAAKPAGDDAKQAGGTAQPSHDKEQ